MSKHHIITIVALLLICGALFATHQFYFKEKLDSYSKAEQEMETLSKRLEGLQKKFKNSDPREYVKAIKGAVQPHREAVEQRFAYFNLRDIWVEEEMPEDRAAMGKFYYEEKFREKYNALMQDAYAHMPPVQIPLDIFTTSFGVPSPESVADYAVNKEDVEDWLTRINFGSALVRLLINANVATLDQLEIWPPRTEFPFLEMYTIGLGFQMRAEDLVPFLDGLRRSDRYFSVNAIRIQNPNLMATYGSPYLQVEMLLTMARYAQDGDKTGAVAAPAAGAGPTNVLFGNNDDDDEEVVPANQSWWSRIWRF